MCGYGVTSIAGALQSLIFPKTMKVDSAIGVARACAFAAAQS
jgi:hypothetical protein